MAFKPLAFLQEAKISFSMQQQCQMKMSNTPIWPYMPDDFRPIIWEMSPATLAVPQPILYQFPDLRKDATKKKTCEKIINKEPFSVNSFLPGIESLGFS